VAVFAKVMDRNAVRDFDIDWSADLSTDDTIATSVWTPPAGITKISESHTDTASVVRLSAAGATAGVEYLIPCHITTANGEQDDQTLILLISET
jgi:hypothetical protein